MKNCGVSITFNTEQPAQHSGPSADAPDDLSHEPLADFFAQQTETPETFAACFPSLTFRKKGNASSSVNSISKLKNDMTDLIGNSGFYNEAKILNAPSPPSILV